TWKFKGEQLVSDKIYEFMFEREASEDIVVSLVLVSLVMVEMAECGLFNTSHVPSWRSRDTFIKSSSFRELRRAWDGGVGRRRDEGLVDRWRDGERLAVLV